MADTIDKYPRLGVHSAVIGTSFCRQQSVRQLRQEGVLDIMPNVRWGSEMGLCLV